MYNIKKTHLLILMLLCSSIGKLLAVPAYPYPVEVIQPDGTTLTIRMHGDEWFHYTTTEDGYMVAKNQQDFYVYATVSQLGQIVPTNRVARNVSTRNIDDASFLKSLNVNSEISRLYNAQNTVSPRKTLRAAAQDEPRKTPSTGSPRFLVLLIEFSDRAFDDRTTAQDRFSKLLNQPGYNNNGSTGSVKDFYKASSYGKFSPNFEVMPLVTLTHTAQYYCDNNGELVPQMIIDACNAADASINFADYDNDNDGRVDNVLCFVAGWDRARGANAATNVWSNRWAVQPGYNYSGTLASTVFDSKYVRDYFVTSELTGTENNSPKTMVNIGTFVHEFGHILGLPDYYHTANSSTHPTLDTWNTMSNGNYNNESRTPPAFSAYDRFYLGWLTPEELTVTEQKTLYPLAQVTVPPANTSGQAYLVAASAHNLNGTAPNPNEFFILEYRKKTGWDAYLPAAGMLVWHIDYDANVWRNNKVNDYSGTTQSATDHMRVYLEPTDGLSQTSPGGAFTSGAFYPKLWNGTDMQRPITNITKNGETSMTFGVAFPVAGTPVAIDATTVQRTEFTANWNLSSGAGSYQLSVYYKDGETKMYDGGGFQDLNVGNVISYNVTSLDRTKATTWHYTIKAVSGGVASDESNEITVKLAAYDGITCEYKNNIQSGEGLVNWTSVGAHNNTYYYSHYAEYYQLSEIKTVTGCKINIRSMQNNSNSENAKITIKLWNKGSNGKPNNILYSEDFDFSQLTTGENALTFETPTVVPAEFFIGWQIYYASENTDYFQVYATSSRGTGGLNTAYFCTPSNNWYAYPEGWLSGDQELTTSFFLFPDVCTFAPEASFTANPQQTTVNSQIVFTNTSQIAPGTAWSWDFGDGEQLSTEENPTHTYSSIGTYTVTLTAANLVGESTAFQQITVQGTPATWTPQFASTAWDDHSNWTPQSVPSVTDRAIIPPSTSYPILTAPATVGEILFKPGAELGRQDLLTYEKAFVQLDFSDPDSRERWWMLTNPLQELYAGDFSFGGLPGMDIKAFVTETDQNDHNGEGVWKSLSGYGHKLEAGDDFQIWLRMDHPTETTKGLRHPNANGIITLPHFEDPGAANVHWTHDHDPVTRQSSFYGWTTNTANEYVRTTNSPVSVTREMSKAYKLLTENSFTATLDFGKGKNKASWFAAAGNPFMSSISFDKLLADNESLIGENYWVWIGAGADNATKPGSYAIWNKTAGALGNTELPLSDVLTPMQSFIVERIGESGTQITFNMANISVTGQSGNSGLRVPAQSNNLLEIIAATPQSAVRAAIASHENGSPLFNRKDSRKFSAGINSLPDIYMLKPAADNSMVAVTAHIVNEITEEIVVPLAIATTYEGPVTLSFTGMDAYNARIFFIDTDLQNKKENELTGQARYDYAFNYVPKKVNGTVVPGENRFFIRLSPTNQTGINPVAPNNMLIYSRHANTIQAVSGELIQRVSVFNLQGWKIYDNAFVNAYEHSVTGLAPGVYVVKVASKQGIKTMKIIVK